MIKHKKQKFPTNRKLVVVGNTLSGKTSLLYAFKNDNFVETHSTTVFEIYSTVIELEGHSLRMSLFDTSSDESYDRLRPLVYPETDVALICYNVDCPTSTTNLISQWNVEIRRYCFECPIILVACKIDLRLDPHIIAALKVKGQKPLSTYDGEQISIQMHADAYMECSAKTRQGVQELLLLAARLSLIKRNNSGTSQMCVLY